MFFNTGRVNIFSSSCLLLGRGVIPSISDTRAGWGVPVLVLCNENWIIGLMDFLYFPLGFFDVVFLLCLCVVVWVWGALAGWYVSLVGWMVG